MLSVVTFGVVCVYTCSVCAVGELESEVKEVNKALQQMRVGAVNKEHTQSKSREIEIPTLYLVKIHIFYFLWQT